LKELEVLVSWASGRALSHDRERGLFQEELAEQADQFPNRMPYQKVVQSVSPNRFISIRTERLL
jgi:hypothetical protein